VVGYMQERESTMATSGLSELGMRRWWWVLWPVIESHLVFPCTDHGGLFTPWTNTKRLFWRTCPGFSVRVDLLLLLLFVPLILDQFIFSGPVVPTTLFHTSPLSLQRPD
jgi:hypothetical protein